MKPEALLAHADFVRALAQSLLKDEHRAEDVIQETWVTALTRPPRHERSLRGWLATVARNLSLMAKRSERSRALREQAVAKREEGSSSARIVEWEATRRQVVDAVLSLGEPYREAVILRYYDDMPPREIAKRLDIPAETAKTHIKRGLAKLRARLDADYNGDRKAWCLALAPVAGAEWGATATGATAIIPGVAAMSAKMKIIAAAGALVVLAAALVILIRYEGREDHPTNDRKSSLGSTALEEEAARPGGSLTPGSGDPAAADLSESSREKVPPSSNDDVAVKGKVMDIDDTPLEGATVEAARVEEYPEDRRMPENLAWQPTGIVSNDAGDFRLMMPRDGVYLSYLRFSHPDYCTEALSTTEAFLERDGSYSLDDLRLIPALFIRGCVKDEEGNPVPGCKVTAPGKPWDHPLQIEDTACTDDNGLFRLRLKKQEAVTVTARLEGEGIGWSRTVTPGKGKAVPHVEIILHEALPISGRVRNNDGTPARKKQLYAEAKTGDYRLKRDTTSDEEGNFLFPPLPPGRYRIKSKEVGLPIEMNRENYGYHILAESIIPGASGLDLHLPGGSRMVIELRDGDGALVDREPTVTFQESKRFAVNPDHPDAGYKYSFGQEYGTTAKLEKVSPGIFAYGNLHEGEMAVEIRVDGYSPVRVKYVEVPPPPGEVALSAVLPPVRSIRGRVFLANGRLAAGVTVASERTGDEPWLLASSYTDIRFNHAGVRIRPRSGQILRCLTNEEGFFHFEGLEEGDHHLFVIVNGLEVCKRSPVTVLDDEPEKDISITLPDLSGSIEGVVRDAAGTLLEGACVIAWDGDDLFNMTRTDEKGWYGFSGLPDGPYVVDARVLASIRRAGRRGFFGSKGKCGHDELAGLNAFNAVIKNGTACRLDLTVADPWNSVIKGRILGMSSKAPDDIEVGLVELDENRRVMFQSNSSPADLFRCKDTFNQEDSDPRTAYYRFENLKAGWYKVKLSYRDQPFESFKESEPVKLGVSSMCTLDIRIALSALEGRVRDMVTKDPVPDARLYLLPVSDNERQGRFGDKSLEIKTDQDGAFKSDAVSEGEFRLVVHHPRYCPLIVDDFIVIEKEDTTNLLFELKPGGCTIDGVLKTKERNLWRIWPEIPPIGAYRYSGGWVSKDGSFRLEGLPPGRVKLLVFRFGDIATETFATLPLPEGERLVIELP